MSEQVIVGTALAGFAFSLCVIVVQVKRMACTAVYGWWSKLLDGAAKDIA